MKFYNKPLGRFGNAIFRYFASIIFTFYYDATITWDVDVTEEFDENRYIDWMKSIESGIIPELNANANYFLTCYYQHDFMIKKHKTRIIEYIYKHMDDKLYDQFGFYHLSGNIIEHNNIKKYDIVVHLRLEDFVEIGMIVNPICISNVLDQILIKYPNSIFCFVLKQPTTEFEKNYLNYFTSRYEIIVESNDVLTDYHILKNARVLVSSMSTLCWISSLMSDSIEEVYFPDYKKINGYCWSHQTFYKPIENTIYYNIEYSSQA